MKIVDQVKSDHLSYNMLSALVRQNTIDVNHKITPWICFCTEYFSAEF